MRMREKGSVFSNVEVILNNDTDFTFHIIEVIFHVQRHRVDGKWHENGVKRLHIDANRSCFDVKFYGIDVKWY